MKIEFLRTILNDKPNLQKHISFNQKDYCDKFNWYPADFYRNLNKLKKLGILTQVKQYRHISKDGKIYAVQKDIDYSYTFKYARCWSVDRSALKKLINQSVASTQNSFENYSITIMGKGNNSGVGLINISQPTTTPNQHYGYTNNLKTVPFYKELLKLKSLWHNKDYNPQEVTEELYKYVKKNKHLLSELLPAGNWNFKFYTSRTKDDDGSYINYYFIHINRRLSDIKFKTHNSDGSKNADFHKFMQENSLTTEFDFKASIHQSLFHLKQSEKNKKLTHFDIDNDVYTDLYAHPSFTREQIKACANRAVFCKSAIGAYNSVIKSGKEVCDKILSDKKLNKQISLDWKELSAYKNASALSKLNKSDAISHIKDIISKVDGNYIMNLWNFESDRNDKIKELLELRGKKAFFNYDCFYTDASEKVARQVAQAAHNYTVLNWSKYKTMFEYRFYDADKTN